MATDNILTNGTIQHLTNYDSKFLYPYTVLSAIIDDDDPSKTGADIIFERISGQIKLAESNAVGQILGTLAGDSNSLSLVKLGVFDKTNSANKYNYLSALGSFEALPEYKFDGVSIPNLTPTNNTLKLSPTFFEYNSVDGLEVKLVPSNITAGKLNTEDGFNYALSAIPYVQGNNIIKYVQPAEVPTASISYILSYTQNGLEWSTPEEFNSINVNSPDAVDTSTCYYLLGTEKQDATVSEVTKAYTADKGIYFKGMTLYNTSDARLKTFTDDICIDFDKLATIKKGLFYWNGDDDKTLQIGVTAQTVKEIFPELVSEQNGIYSVSYDKLSVVALAAIDKLHEENVELKKKVEELENKLK